MEFRSIDAFDTWYSRLAAHVGAFLGLLISPITYPISIAMCLWMRFKGWKYLAEAQWQLTCAAIRFQWDHNLAKYCEAQDEYFEKCGVW